MFRKTTCVVLMLMFIFRPSVATLASDTASGQQKIKKTAEADANRDINKAVWYTVGIGTSAAACFGCFLGYMIAYKSYPSVHDYDYAGAQPSGDKKCLDFPIPTTLRVLGCLGGASACGGILVLGMYNNPVNPPWQRLIGKSPEYVASYTAAYTAKARSLQRKSAAAGVATGVAGFVLIVYLLDALGI